MRGSIVAAMLLIAACEREAAVPTAEENVQLDDAANLLNQAPASLEQVDDGGLGLADENVGNRQPPQ